MREALLAAASSVCLCACVCVCVCARAREALVSSDIQSVFLFFASQSLHKYNKKYFSFPGKVKDSVIFPFIFYFISFITPSLRPQPPTLKRESVCVCVCARAQQQHLCTLVLSTSPPQFFPNPPFFPFILGATNLTLTILAAARVRALRAPSLHGVSLC